MRRWGCLRAVMTICFIALSLQGCGGGGGGGSTTPATNNTTITTATGKFIDAPVEGLKYASGGQSGLTGTNGEFIYEVGKTVSFSVGSVTLGQAIGKSIVTPLDLVQYANTGTTVTVSTPSVVQIAQFLLTVSALTSTGIKIDPDVNNICSGQNINLSTTSSPNFATMINSVAAGSSYRQVTSAIDAQNHLTSSMNGLSSGTVVLPPASITGSGTTPTILASAEIRPSAIAVDSAFVYWFDMNGTLKKVPVNGGDVTVLAVNTYVNTLAMAIDSNSIYFRGQSGLSKISKNGGQVQILAQESNNDFSSLTHITLDSTNVYWSDRYSLRKVGINGGPVEVLHTFSSADNYAIIHGDIVTDSSYVYWLGSESLNIFVFKISVNGGDVTKLAQIGSHAGDWYGMAIDSNNLYWAEGGTIRKMAKNGGDVSIIAVSTVGTENVWGQAIFVDSNYIYWKDRHRLKKVGINGGAVTNLSLSLKTALAINSTSIFWTSGDYIRNYNQQTQKYDPIIGTGYINKISK